MKRFRQRAPAAPASDMVVADGRRTYRPDPLAVLSDREEEALGLMAEWLSNGGIAARLRVGVRTVETYIGAIFTKLGIYNDADELRRVKARPGLSRHHDRPGGTDPTNTAHDGSI